MMESTTCPACGEVLPARAIFCRKCGTRLQPESAEAPAQSQQDLNPGDQATLTRPQEPAETLPEQPFAPFVQPDSGAPPMAVSAVPERSSAPPASQAAPPAWPSAPAQPLAQSSPPAPGSMKATSKPEPKKQKARSAGPGRKQRRVGLFLLIAALLLVVLAGGVLGVVVLNQKHILVSKAPTPTSTPRPTFTPTPDRTRGFRQFSNSKYSLLYPAGWAALPALSLSKDDEEFIASPQEMFQVQVIAQSAGQPTPKLVDDVTCQTFFGANNKPDAPTMVSFANQQWTRETCEGTINGTAMQVLVESAVYQNQVFTIFYNAPQANFLSDQQQYFTPMEQSFTFVM